jgi:hypothetical protein
MCFSQAQWWMVPIIPEGEAGRLLEPKIKNLSMF